MRYWVVMHWLNGVTWFEAGRYVDTEITITQHNWRTTTFTRICIYPGLLIVKIFFAASFLPKAFWP